MIQSTGASKWVTVGSEDGSSGGTDRRAIAAAEPTFDTGELFECLCVVHHQGDLRVQLVYAGLQGLDFTNLLNDFLAETLDSQLFLEVSFGIIEEMYKVLDSSDADVRSKGELTVLFPRFLRADKSLNVDDLLEILPVVSSLRSELPTLNSTSKQCLKKDGDIFTCPQVVPPSVVILADQGAPASGLEPNYVRFNKLEFLSSLPVLCSGESGSGTSLEAVDGRNHLNFRECLGHCLMPLPCEVCPSTSLDVYDSCCRFAKVPNEDE